MKIKLCKSDCGTCENNIHTALVLTELTILMCAMHPSLVVGTVCITFYCHTSLALVNFIYIVDAGYFNLAMCVESDFVLWFSRPR